jgi:hypothetical protein
VAALKRAQDGKAEALFYDSVVPGATLQDGLQKALDEAIAKLPIPKLPMPLSRIGRTRGGSRELLLGGGL